MKRIRVKQIVKEATLKTGEATLGLLTKSGLRPNSRYKASLYTWGGSYLD